MSDTSVYSYRKLFDETQPNLKPRPAAEEIEEVADRAPPAAYVFDEDILLCVNLALATGRPLLVRGPSGCGKSALARAVASCAGWSFYALPVTSRTLSSDLLYEIDHLKRLQDAYRGKINDDERFYLTPGPLYWGFDQETAYSLLEMTKRASLRPAGYVANAPRAVVLLDEIDKADPDVPNNLLGPLGQLEFAVPGQAEGIRAHTDRTPLLILTTNEERDLPPAFLRRCVELVIPQLTDDEPTVRRLFEIARRHGLDLGDAILRRLAEAFFASSRRDSRPASVAEYLDLLRAWKELDLGTNENERTMSAVLNAITQVGNGD